VGVGKEKGFATKTLRHEEYLIADYADFRRLEKQIATEGTEDSEKKLIATKNTKNLTQINTDLHRF